VAHIYYTRQSCDPAKVVLSRFVVVWPGEQIVSISEAIRDGRVRILVSEVKINTDIQANPCRWYHFRERL